MDTKLVIHHCHRVMTHLAGPNRVPNGRSCPANVLHEALSGIHLWSWMGLFGPNLPEGAGIANLNNLLQSCQSEIQIHRLTEIARVNQWSVERVS